MNPFICSVSQLKSRFPTEFDNFAKCLDYNDYRFEDCRSSEQALKDCWNKAQGYVTAPQTH